MKQHAAIVIAALMITSIAFAISVSNVTATHERTASIDDNTVKGNTSMVRIITIANNGPDAIDNVQIILPTGWSPATLIKIFKDNEVRLGDLVETGSDNNVVKLLAGTIVELPATTSKLNAPENTPVIIPKDTTIRWKPVGENVDAKLLENLEAKIQNPGGITISLDAENFELAEDIEEIKLDSVADEGLLVRLMADTLVILGEGENVVRLPEDTLVELVNETEFTLDIENKITTTGEVDISDSIIKYDPPTENYGDNFVATAGATTNTIYKVEPGDENIMVHIGGTVVIPLGTELKVEIAISLAKLFENTEVIRGANENVTVENIEVAENQPNGWAQSSMEFSTLPPGEYVEWVGDENNQIASGKSLDFPFAFMSPGSGDYTIYVKTKDTKGVVVQTEIALTTDNTPPTVEIAVSPEWAKASTAITITVTASETLAKLDNVMVAENNATENTQISMTPNADNTVWTGTYTTGDNENRDGTATIYVIGSQYEDLNGNTGTGDNTETFTVDRLAPPAPDLSPITGFPTSPTTTATWFIENEAMDNFLGNLVPLEGGTVKIRVGTTVYDVTPSTSGYYSKSITLTEGTQEVGIQYIDRAGNVGEENAENITLDTIAPSITLGMIADKPLVDGVRINDNAPKITLTISDVGLGVDNIDFINAVENEGYSVQLWDADKLLEVLVNALAHDNNVLAFENTIPAQADNTYRIYVVAGDGQLMDNALIEFVIDTVAPGAPSVGAAYEIVSTMDNPVVVKSTSRTIAGDAETGETITVYGTVDTTETVLGTGTAGSGWIVTLTLTTGSNTKIEISATDVAGNEGPRTLYGWMLADASAPAVTLGTLPGTTDETSVILSGTVTKDTWEDWSDITLTAQVGIGSVEVQIGAEGGYSCSVPLSMGVNTIAVRATDYIGNASIPATATVDRVVSMDTSAPGVTLEALPEATGTASVTISGTVIKDAWESWSDITLTVQVGTGRVEVPIGAGGSYSYSIELAEGPNTIAVQATDAVGNAGTAAYATVERTVTPWGTYAIVFVIIALVIAAIAIFRGPKIWKR